MQKNEKIILIAIAIFLLVVIGCSEFNYFRTQRELRNLSKSLSEAQQTVELLRDGIGQQESIIRELTGKESAVDGTIGAIRGTAKQLEDSLRITLGGIEDDEEEQP